MEKQITIKYILDPIPVSLFFKEYWNKKHLVIRRNKYKNLLIFKGDGDQDRPNIL